MSTEATIVLRPEVAAFIAAVRVHLGDLDPEEQREILDGLEADLDELVAEHGSAALGDPADYAAELRQAAGLAEQKTVARTSLGTRVHLMLDACAEGWARIVGALPGDVAGVLVALQPAWWVLRAWVAVQTALIGSSGSNLTLLPDDSVAGGVVLLVAIFGSVQLGRGKLWPGDGWRQRAGLRLLLLGLNILAIMLVAPVGSALQSWDENEFDRGFASAVDEATAAAETSAGVLQINGRPVTNIFPYDATGQPLLGVQLYDAAGKPLNVTGWPTCPSVEEDVPGETAFSPDDLADRTDDFGNPVNSCTDSNGSPVKGQVFYPWTNGQAQLLNVFPVAIRSQDSLAPSATAFTETDRPKVGPFPLAQVPKVSLPGISTKAR